jgi:hypothetical protein
LGVGVSFSVTPRSIRPFVLESGVTVGVLVGVGVTVGVLVGVGVTVGVLVGAGVTVGVLVGV